MRDCQILCGKMKDIQFMLNFSRKLRQARAEAGFSQKEIGEAIGLSDKAVSTYETGSVEPSLENLNIIAKLTNKPISYFFEED